MRYVVWAVICAGVTIAASSVPQDTSGQQARFKSEVRLALLDVTVVDKNQVAVRGLTAGDFAVVENGVPKPVITFSEIDLPPPAASRAEWHREIGADVASNDLDGRRLLAIILDDATIPFEPLMISTAKKTANDVIDRMSAGDLTAVVFTQNSRRAQEFTSDRSRLRAAIDRFRPGSGGTMNLASVATLQNVTKVLAEVPGRRKTIIYISAGVPLNFNALAPGAGGDENRDLLRILFETFREARAANISVYSFDPAGLAGLSVYLQQRRRIPPNEAHQRARLNTEFLQAVASNTNGWAAVNTNELTTKVGQLFRENASYYLIGYEPVSDPDSQRKIEIRVSRPDVHLKARTMTYRDPGYLRNLDLTALQKGIVGLLPQGDLPMRLAAMPVRFSDEITRVVLALSVAPGVSQVQANGNTELLVAVYTHQGEHRGSSQHVVHNQAAFDWISALDLSPGKYLLRASAQNTVTKRTGSVYLDLEVPSFSRSSFSLSGVAIGAESPRHTVVSGNVSEILPIGPTTEREFPAGTILRAFFAVYGVRPADNPMGVAINIKNADGTIVFEKRLGPMDLSNANLEAGQTVTLPTDTLPPGAYLLTIAAEKKRERVERYVRFELT